MYNEHYFEKEYDCDYDSDPVLYSGALKHICEHLEAVLSELYGNQTIDLCLLENSLDEVAHGLGMRLPCNDLSIQRKRKEIDRNLIHFEFDSIPCQKVVA